MSVFTGVLALDQCTALTDKIARTLPKKMRLTGDYLIAAVNTTSIFYFLEVL